MERITITIETGNAAFEDEPATEIARILRDIAARFEAGSAFGGVQVRDINGNTCGGIEIKPARRTVAKRLKASRRGTVREGRELDASEARGLARMAGDMDA